MIISKKLFKEISKTMVISLKGSEYTARVVIFDYHSSYNDLKIVLPEDIKLPGDYFDLRNGEISFHPHPELQKFSESNQWVRDGRVTIKPGKFLSFIKEFISVHDSSGTSITNTVVLTTIYNKLYEIFTSHLNGSKITFPILLGEGTMIKRIYHGAYSSEDCGTLNTSCMRLNSSYDCHNGAGQYRRWRAKILYCTDDDGYLRGRALLWDNVLVNTSEGDKYVTFMDRIYGNESMISYFIDYAQNNGYWYKINQDSSSFGVTDGENSGSVINYKIPDKNWKKEEYSPYMDTFCSADDEYLTAQSHNKYLLQKCDGTGFKEQWTCPHCGYTYDSNQYELCSDSEDGNDNNIGCSNCVTYCEYMDRHVFNELTTEAYDRNGYCVVVEESLISQYGFVQVNIRRNSYYVIPNDID